MRLLYTEKNAQINAKKLSDFLTIKNIKNHFEIDINRDWGSADYGTFTSKVWVVEEDQFDEAKKLLEDFESMDKENIVPIPQSNKPLPIIKPEESKRLSLTAYLIILCSILFFISQLTAPRIPSNFLPSMIPNLPLTPLVSSSFRNLLMYDFPKAYDFLAELVDKYGLEGLEHLNDLPEQGKRLIEEYQKHPYWQGLYDKILLHLMHPEQKIPFNEPLFEKIQEGQIWRIFTPILLHGDIFHLLFNMLWLYVLGKQIEERIGILRFSVFILIAAAFTNTLQYLMTGPNFIGFSGVLCAMITYVWMRQRKTPWEGYQLQRTTFLLIMIFIFGVFSIQVLSFFVELYNRQMLPVTIANTAHLSGLAIGLLFGKMKFFARQT